MEPRTHRALISFALALAMSVTALPALAASPEPSTRPPATHDLALAAVRAVDPRFADLPLFRGFNASFADPETYFAGSWLDVIPTGAVIGGPRLESFLPTWFDPRDRLVEVMLVDDCVEVSYFVGEVPDVDPCGWRHQWLYRVLPSGEAVLLYDQGSPDVPPG